MSVKIRLSRAGTKRRPFYKIVVADSRSPRDGRFLERVGHYNPLLKSDHPERLVLMDERVKYWLSVGAEMTERVELLVSTRGVVAKPAVPNRPKKSAPKKKAQERLEAQAAASAGE